MNNNEPVTVYYDGACHLCRFEIAHYNRQNKDGCVLFVDASQPDADLGEGLTYDRAMARLHLRFSDGRMTSGAAAFVEIWKLLPRWRWAARIAQLPGIIHLLEFMYRLFLPLRPVLSRLFGWLSGAPSKDAKISHLDRK